MGQAPMLCSRVCSRFHASQTSESCESTRRDLGARSSAQERLEGGDRDGENRSRAAIDLIRTMARSLIVVARRRPRTKEAEV
jgi:hypothetical protein